MSDIKVFWREKSPLNLSDSFALDDKIEGSKLSLFQNIGD